MKSLIPNLAVKSIEETISYYEDNLGFKLQMAVDSSKEGFYTTIIKSKEYIWAIVAKDNVSIMLQKEKSIKEDIGFFYEKLGASLSLYIEVDSADTFYEEIKNKVEIVKPLNTTWYGQREFYIKDINGYILGFASKM